MALFLIKTKSSHTRNDFRHFHRGRIHYAGRPVVGRRTPVEFTLGVLLMPVIGFAISLHDRSGRPRAT